MLKREYSEGVPAIMQARSLIVAKVRYSAFLQNFLEPVVCRVGGDSCAVCLDKERT